MKSAASLETACRADRRLPADVSFSFLTIVWCRWVLYPSGAYFHKLCKQREQALIQESDRMEAGKSLSPQFPLHLWASEAVISRSWRLESPASTIGPAHVGGMACPQHWPSHLIFLGPLSLVLLLYTPSHLFSPALYSQDYCKGAEASVLTAQRTRVCSKVMVYLQGTKSQIHFILIFELGCFQGEGKKRLGFIIVLWHFLM